MKSAWDEQCANPRYGAGTLAEIVFIDYTDAKRAGLGDEPVDVFNTIISSVTAVSTVALVWATWKLASLTELLANETRLAREHAARADVQSALERDNENPEAIEIVIKNVSGATAKGITVLIYSGEGMIPNSHLGPFIYKIPSLLPGSHWKFYSHKKEETDGKNLNVDIEFHDGFAARKNFAKYDLVNWHDVNVKSRQPERRVVAALERIANSVSAKKLLG